MVKGFFNVPKAVNESVLNYAPKSPEKLALKKAVAEMKSEQVDVPMYVGAEEVRTGKKISTAGRVVKLT